MHTKYTARYDEHGNIILDAIEESITVNSREDASVSDTWKVDTVSDSSEEVPELCVAPHAPAERYMRHREEKRGLPQFRIVTDAVRFTGTFVAVFLFLFVSLNLPSFVQIFQAKLMPGSQESPELSAMTDPALRGKLLSIPQLPTAGADADITHQVLPVAPPDNRLVIPKIGKNIPLVELSGAAMAREDWTTFEKDAQHALRFGVVHYPGTAIPGQIGNVFITGHSSYYPWDSGKYKDVFALLPTLEVGDEYSVYYNGDLHHYRIAKKFEVSPKDTSVLDQPGDRYMSTLMTCTPVGTTLRRLILQADEIDQQTGESIAVGNADDPAV